MRRFVVQGGTKRSEETGMVLGCMRRGEEDSRF